MRIEIQTSSGEKLRWEADQVPRQGEKVYYCFRTSEDKTWPPVREFVVEGPPHWKITVDPCGTQEPRIILYCREIT